LANDPEEEEAELAAIYESRGLEPSLALEVARQLMKKDSLGAHARDEIGITEELGARPFQAAFFSAAAFTCGAIVPVSTALLAPSYLVIWMVPATAIVFLGVLGAVAASAGGASPARGALRVCFWGSLAMGLTALIGKIFGVAT
jgi:VIT1/CCC1 family predicted Fe2+/Mn2+ transporter